MSQEDLAAETSAGKVVMNKTSIEDIDYTWNPVTGCTKISRGCQHCYAERMARRLKAIGQRCYRRGFTLPTHPDAPP